MGQETVGRELGGNWRKGNSVKGTERCGLGTGTCKRELLGTGGKKLRQGLEGNWGKGNCSKLGTGNLGQGTGDRELGGNWRKGNSVKGTEGMGLGTGTCREGIGSQGAGDRNWGQETVGRELELGGGATRTGGGNWDRVGGRELGAAKGANWGLLGAGVFGDREKTISDAIFPGSRELGGGGALGLKGCLRRELGTAGELGDRELGQGTGGTGNFGQGTWNRELGCREGGGDRELEGGQGTWEG